MDMAGQYPGYSVPPGSHPYGAQGKKETKYLLSK